MWQRVAKLSEIPDGSGKTVQCAGPTFGIFRTGNQVYALDNTCPHRGAALSEGGFDGKEIICPWHAWTFDVKTGKCITTPDVHQKTYPVKIDGEDILIDF